ncbi:short chain dehydrogenase [compost metagenome]
MTGLLLPRLLNTPSSRVVTLSSLAAHGASIDFDNLDGSKGYSSWKFYGQSKLANMMFARELHNKLSLHKLNTVSVACHPGFSNTNLMSFGSGKRANPLMRLITYLGTQPAHMGALPSLYSATSPNIRGGEYIGPDGRGGRKGYPKSDPIINKLYQPNVSHRLWEVSEQLTGVAFKFDKE